MTAARIVLFDLDGTLSDSAPGILAALRHAFCTHGLPPLEGAAARAVLGPPFHQSLPPLIGAAPLAEVIGSYRQAYQGGAMFDTTVYPGVADLLTELQASGVRLAVATSKPEAYAVPIVDYLGLGGFFETVAGDDLDGSYGTKARVIGRALRRLGEPDSGAVRMVGDRSHDVDGARAHGIGCLAVGWGYALPGELASARPERICATPGEVGAALRAGDAGAAAT